MHSWTDHILLTNSKQQVVLLLCSLCIVMFLSQVYVYNEFDVSALVP